MFKRGGGDHGVAERSRVGHVQRSAKGRREFREGQDAASELCQQLQTPVLQPRCLHGIATGNAQLPHFQFELGDDRQEQLVVGLNLCPGVYRR